MSEKRPRTTGDPSPLQLLARVADAIESARLTLDGAGAEGALEMLAVAANDLDGLREEILRANMHDPLTGLPNQIAFAERLVSAMEEATRTRRVVGVMFIDVDRFRNINDTLGHALGDRLLQRVAARLCEWVPAGSVFRMAGDEFLLLLTDLGDEADAARIATTLRDRMREPFALEEEDLYLTASVGVALFPYDGEDLTTLVKNADSAMYRAKERGGDDLQVYSASMETRVFRRLSLETGLRRAVDRGELTLHYQPIVLIASGEVVGVEALARWRHPDLGVLFPSKFMWLAEETGLVVPIGEWVMREACEQIVAWRRSGVGDVRVAINVGARQFQQHDLVQMIARTAKEAGLDPAQVQIEITESVAMRNPARTTALLHELRGMGIETALDDFGTGHSSLNYLKRFAVDVLKLDQAFVRGVMVNANDAAIAAAVVALARGLGLTVIAEGVETPEQLAFLRSHGCHQMQGYLFSRPLPADDCAALLLSGKRL